MAGLRGRFSMRKQTHLTFDNRLTIQLSLKEKKTFRDIAECLSKDPTTVSKEIRRNSTEKEIGAFGKPHNSCRHRMTCDYRLLCDDSNCRKSFCRFCFKCNALCESYEEEICPLLSKPPYVCNGCPQRPRCQLKKKMYEAKVAQKRYQTKLTTSRSGLAIEADELTELDAFLSPLIKKNQSLHHICTHNSDQIMWSEKTLYKYINLGCFTARNIDLPRKVRYRPRRKSRAYKVDKACRLNRTYLDFQQFSQDNPDTSIVEMDTVEGRKGGSVFLTLFFRNCHFMLIFLRPRNDSHSVIEIFNTLFEELGATVFGQLFPVILTDNGSEFSNPFAIEFDQHKQRRTRLFYCDPGRPDQKAQIEKNHEEIRYILPKGTSFDELDSTDVKRIMNHINAKTRKKLNSKTPSLLFSTLYGEETFDKLHASFVKPNDVCLTPRLLKQLKE